MPRVKGGPKTRQRRKKVLKMAKGYVGGRSRLYRTAVDAVHRALAYAYRDRRARKRDFRRLMDHSHQCGSETPWSFLQPFNGCPEESPCRVRPEDIGRFSSERSQCIFKNC